MEKYFIITYGCQMNKSDSERIAPILEKTGYSLVSKQNEADLIVVNMCSVRQSAVDRVYGLSPEFKKLKKENPNLKTILTGCVLRADKRKFKKHFDLILNIKDLTSWSKFLVKEKTPLVQAHLKIKPRYKTNFQAFIPISSGCNNACAYCVVPSTRGALFCKSHKDIAEEAKTLIKKGIKEIWLLGQNVNDYQSPTNPSIKFPDLLKIVNEIEGNFWIRFVSSNPKDFSDKLINKIANCEKVTEYLNLPVQSGDNKILKKMNRPYKVEEYKNLVKKIRQKIPDIALSTDIIVGFPGETKKQFENTLSFFKEIQFEMAYIAQYSPRSQTTAFFLKDNVSRQEKERRYKILTQILKEIALRKNKKYIGKEIEVLVDKQKKDSLYGKTRKYKTVKIPVTSYKVHDTNLIGQFIKVKITKALPWGLKGILKL